jgi:hypothetical protein
MKETTALLKCALDMSKMDQMPQFNCLRNSHHRMAMSTNTMSQPPLGCRFHET